jgi:hypothetical protein
MAKKEEAAKGSGGASGPASVVPLRGVGHSRQGSVGSVAAPEVKVGSRWRFDADIDGYDLRFLINNVNHVRGVFQC